jgi:hypothetical protein
VHGKQLSAAGFVYRHMKVVESVHHASMDLFFAIKEKREEFIISIENG